MPLFAYTEKGLVVEAANFDSTDMKLFCCQCRQPVCFVRSSGRVAAYFRHIQSNKSCSASTSQVVHESLIDASGITNVTRAMTSWHASWQALGLHTEVLGIGDDIRRPRDLGCVETNAILELQHSPISTEEFSARNAGVAFATWIFDATTANLMQYKYADDVWFCLDQFHQTYPTGGTRRVLFHCADRQLYQTMCDGPLCIEVNGETRHVRLLTKLDSTARYQLDHFLGANWPLQKWDDSPVAEAPVLVSTPIRVLGENGRFEVDQIHRNYMYRPPREPCTVILAPPGAGKTTAILEMIRKWRLRVLVITFNAATKETMQQRISQARLRADTRTIDSLCYEACGHPELMKWSDWELCCTFWERSAHTKFNRNGGGRRAHNIVDFRFRHPRATHVICKKHQRLGMKGHPWDAGFSSYPMHHIVQGNYKGKGCMTHAACRYICDRDGLLKTKLDKYDVVLVDEMQDLMSAQEQRLIFQANTPVVLVGDLMQAINNFRDDPPCAVCQLEQEDAPKLPRAIEWYGTWRLDSFTARFIEERFGRRMHSYRAVGEDSEVYWKDDIVYAPTLVMCRYNKHVVEMATRFQSMRVVNGEMLAKKLVTASKDDSMVTPMAEYAHQLLQDDKLEDVCEMLRKRDIRLSDVQNVAAVTTVHQAKGFEYDHCAVHADLLDASTEDERNISFVAFTRHKKSLVVLHDPLSTDIR